MADVSAREKSGFWGLAFILVGVIVGATVYQIGPLAMAEASGFSASLIFFLGWGFWHERRRRWFWVYMAAVVLAHAVLIATTPWPEHRQASKEDGLFGFVDVIFTVSIGYFTSVLLNKTGKARAH